MNIKMTKHVKRRGLKNDLTIEKQGNTETSSTEDV